MANWKKAQTHHGHMAKAISAKNHALAMHHAGHVMAALRQPDAQEGGEAIEPMTEPKDADDTQPMGLRGRLAKMKQSFL